jgi:hypothetical protein
MVFPDAEVEFPDLRGLLQAAGWCSEQEKLSHRPMLSYFINTTQAGCCHHMM